MTIRSWSFKDYSVHYIDTENLLKFESTNGTVIGHITNVKENDLINELDKGANPIKDGWEDGAGNTINIDGW